MKASDRVFLQATIELAEQGRFTCAPNPTVGCIIVRDGAIIGRGYHHLTGSGHAEVNAIADAAGDVAGATVYVSLEPCAFVSRTPACAQTLIDAGVARVVIAAQDPHPRVSGSGIGMLRAAGIEANLLTQQEALDCIVGYATRVELNRPFVRIKTASSIDGAIALASGESQWITGQEARADVQYWRARSDAVITGVGTVLADNPRLTVRDPTYANCHQPLRVVLDANLRTPADAHLLSDGIATLVVHNADASIPDYFKSLDSIELLAADSGPRDLDALLTALAERGCNEVLVEAGPRVCGSFVQAALWDEWLCYVAPKWLGAGAQEMANFTVPQLVDAPSGSVVEFSQVGKDMRVRIEPDRD